MGLFCVYGCSPATDTTNDCLGDAESVPEILWSHFVKSKMQALIHHSLVNVASGVHIQ